jgi:hypothetical protein
MWIGDVAVIGSSGSGFGRNFLLFFDHWCYIDLFPSIDQAQSTHKLGEK